VKKRKSKYEEEKTVQMWTCNIILLFLKMWQEQFSSLKTRKKAIWIKIASARCEAGFDITFSQAESKWKNPTRTYSNTAENNTGEKQRQVSAY